uniref:SDR family oxidoreductase n=1 Tax=Halomonas sp. TaxID=1486246 RepID=UPI00345A8AE3
MRITIRLLRLVTSTKPCRSRPDTGAVPAFPKMRGRGITVNAVAPGPVATEMFFEGKSDEQIASIAAMAPLERLGQPD